MLGPYEAIEQSGLRKIYYRGNKIFEPVDDVQASSFTDAISRGCLRSIVHNEYFQHLHTVDNLVFFGTIEYFKNLGAQWCNLPLTTLMISSPGEMYRGKKLNYTTDSLPVQIDWFDLPRKIFLSESSQFYLELRLLQEKVDKVFSIYNSFRKDKADFSHLSEFQHIEFEGKIGYGQNLNIALGLLNHITKKIISEALEALKYFLTDAEINSLAKAFDKENTERIPFKNALVKLYEDTGDERYRDFSLKHFGAWEEVRLTQLLGKHVVVEQFPLLEIPFYHNELRRNENGIPLSESADIILAGYRESVGSGVRIKSYEALMEKAKIFNLPQEDYLPYLEMRKDEHYQKTAGFGLGWQRYVQWLLKLPYIWDACHIPRGHRLPRP